MFAVFILHSDYKDQKLKSIQANTLVLFNVLENN